MAKVIFRTLNRIHIFLYRSSGGSILGKIAGSPVLLLTTTGRKSGKRRTVPLVYAVDGECYAVIASDNPGWHHNLSSNPQAQIEVRKQRYSVTARETDADESKRWWARIVEQSPAFKSSQDRPNHKIVVLERTSV